MGWSAEIPYAAAWLVGGLLVSVLMHFDRRRISHGWLTVPLLDVPMLYLVVLSALPGVSYPQTVAASMTGTMLLLIFVVSMSVERTGVVVTGGLAMLAQLALMRAAGTRVDEVISQEVILAVGRSPA